MIFNKCKAIIAAVLILLPAIGFAQSGLSNGTAGREFYIAIPPNEKADAAARILDIYVTSNVNTIVTVEIPGLGYLKSKPVEAFKTTTFGTADGIGANLEIRDSEIKVPYGIRITSPDPVSVNVINSKSVSSDGFTALPVSVWGKENIHCSFYDFGESKPWGGGFIVVASRDQTVLNITLRGLGFGRTVGGRKIGEVIQVTLQKGEVYMVRGNGATQGSFDLTGSLIRSTKPVGLISFHERTMIPAIANNNGRDHLSEMIPPTSAWGKKFVSAEFKRKDKGDLFRVVAKEDNTMVSCSWYDNGTNQIIGKLQWVLKAGQFGQSLYASTSPGGEDIRGYSVWESNKPILLMQYAYSAQWDGTSQFDPMMIVIPPVEQYVQNAVIQTPANVSFSNNSFNLFAIGDSIGTNQNLLKSIKLDGKLLYETDPKILLQRIPGTNIYYIEKNLTPGVHRIESNTKISGFMYGFSDFDTYGWPAAMSVNKIDELDSLAPTIQMTQDCGTFKITTRENRNGNTSDDPRQIESGISDVMLIAELSTNFKTQLDPVAVFSDPVQYSHNFNLEVADLTKDARAVYEVIDRAGNVARDSVTYVADKLSVESGLDFGKVRVGTTKELNVVVRNNGTQPIQIQSFKNLNGDVFQVIGGAVTLPPGGVNTIRLRYTPKFEYTAQFQDKDSLLIETNCALFPQPIIGRGVIPKIAVGDFNAGLVKIGEKVCLEKGLFVTNPGTEEVTITGVSGFDTPFTFTNIAPTFPITLMPGDTLFLKDVCFQASVGGNFVQNITFKSDAMSGDSISEWRGSTTTTGIDEVLKSNNLLKVSPNPASNGEIEIEYSVFKTGNIVLEIFDATGKSVKILLKENSETGIFKTGFSAAELPVGLYHCRISIDNIPIASEEIVIVK